MHHDTTTARISIPVQRKLKLHADIQGLPLRELMDTIILGWLESQPKIIVLKQ